MTIAPFPVDSTKTLHCQECRRVGGGDERAWYYREHAGCSFCGGLDCGDSYDLECLCLHHPLADEWDLTDPAIQPCFVLETLFA